VIRTLDVEEVPMSRPAADPVGPGQESVLDYPRPPRVEPSTELVEVEVAGRTIVSTRRAVRVLETSQAPAYYLPIDDVAAGVLRPCDRRTHCEWKGSATYYDVVVGDRVVAAAAWRYPSPSAGFEELADRVAFYPGLMDECRIDGEVVRSMEGGFYGGWITSRIVGPFKGAPGTQGW
jgi:uncharacterized protein (DUF427 family)